MTIKKAQGLTLTYCGNDMDNNYFSREQLHVVFTRAGRLDIYTFLHIKIKR